MPACRIPNTTQNMPTAERTAPIASNGRVGSGGRGSTIRRLSKMIVATTSGLEDECGSPADRRS